MKSNFQILANGKDITRKIADRLLSLTVVDEAGMNSDTVAISIDDRDSSIEFPRTGAKLEVTLGYEEDKLKKTGVYTVDEVSMSWPPQSMSINGKAANMLEGIKATKTRPWDNITIGDLVNKIAGEHSLIAKVGDDLASMTIEHLDQTSESDLHLLTRLATQYDAISKPVAGKWLFVKRAQGKSVSGKELPVVSLKPKDVTSWNVTISGRAKYGSVTADWHDNLEATREIVKVGEGKPIFNLTQSFPNEAQAKTAAKAALARLKRGTGSLEITVQGNAALMVEGVLVLKGFREGVDGRWSINRVIHTINNKGFITTAFGESEGIK
ncbi:MAG: hypothetical protein HQL71_12955 [Magnetococcales bacterium]|nr:hypothetical protein [Magnetococcales bacterium]